MSDKEKTLVEKIRELPTALQEKFGDRVDGAIMAMEALALAAGEKKNEGQDE